MSQLLDIKKDQNMSEQSRAVEQKALVARCFKEACKRLSPIWDIRDYVAVNPFFGFRDQSFLDVAKFFKRYFKIGILPKKEYFLKKYTSGEIAEHDLALAIRLFQKEASDNQPISIDQLLNFIKSREEDGDGIYSRCVSSLYDLENQSEMTETITKEISKWAAAYFDETQAVWKIPNGDLRLFSWWKALAKHDRPFRKDSDNFTRLVNSLPHDPFQALQILTEKLLERVSLEPLEITHYFYGLMYTIIGWSSYIQKFEFEAIRSGDDTRLKKIGGLVDIVAIRMTYDVSLLQENLEFKYLKKDHDENLKSVDYAYIWLIAAEIVYRRNIEAAITRQIRQDSIVPVPDIQAAFCIDVRSEILRRHLETLSPKIQTIGFAGFFAMPISLKGLGHQESDQNCPVLLNSNYVIREIADEEGNRLTKKKSNYVHNLYLRKAIQSSANSGFSFMETLGFSYIHRIIKSSLGKKPNIDFSSLGLSLRERKHIHLNLSKLSLDKKVNLAYGALKNMGLTKNIAKYVFFFGHGSESGNNPYASALDCGACAGHNGKANASLLATLLNQKEVRAELINKGIEIPDRTVFLSGWHNTTKDDLIIDEVKDLNDIQKNDLKNICKIFGEASENCRIERAEKLPGAKGLRNKALKKELNNRANDWSEIRPEWGLARNASFIVGSRELTRSLNLDGRAFLHDYDQGSDQDLSTLELIMTAPMIVTNWINMQYYASTVDPQKFGAGNKVLNNIVGGIGCIQGNDSDLLGGLGEQSVRYKGEYYHEPIRLQVFIEADPSAIDKIIQKHQMVKELALHNWLNITSINPKTKEFKLYQGGSWIQTKEEVWN